MSIICTTYTPEAIVMAADSRVSVNMNFQNKEDAQKSFTQIFPMSDNTQKIFLLRKTQVGISAISGLSGALNQTIEQFVHNFERKVIKEGDSVFDVAEKLRMTMKNENASEKAVCHVAGYDGNEPFFYSVSSEKSKRINMQNAELEYGITWSGEIATLQKLFMTEPKLSIDIKALSVADTVEFTEFLMDTVIKLQKFEMKPKVCGGPVDVLLLTRDGAMWCKHKLFGREFIEMPKNKASGYYVTDAEGNTIN